MRSGTTATPITPAQGLGTPQPACGWSCNLRKELSISSYLIAGAADQISLSQSRYHMTCPGSNCKPWKGSSSLSLLAFETSAYAPMNSLGFVASELIIPPDQTPVLRICSHFYSLDWQTMRCCQPNGRVRQRKGHDPRSRNSRDVCSLRL
jgi:hypothetical protein